MREEEKNKTGKIERERLICRFLDASYKLKLPTVREREIGYAALQIDDGLSIGGRLTIFDSNQGFSFDPTSQWVGYLEEITAVDQKHRDKILSLVQNARPTKLKIIFFEQKQPVDVDVYVEDFIKGRKEIILCSNKLQIGKGFSKY